MAKGRAFDYVQVPLAIVATDMTGATVEAEGAYFRVVRVIAVSGPMTLEAIRETIGGQSNRVERLLDHRSSDAEPLLSFGWLEEWRERANAARSRLSAAGKTSAALRASKKGKRNKRSTDVTHGLNSSSTNVEHATILSSTVNQEGDEKERAGVGMIYPAWSTDLFKTAWDRWKAYKAERNERYKPIGEQATLSKIATDFASDAQFITAMEHSMANGWKGIFKPKPGQTRPQDTASRKNIVW